MDLAAERLFDEAAQGIRAIPPTPITTTVTTTTSIPTTTSVPTTSIVATTSTIAVDRRAADTRAIQAVLDRFQAAYSALDAAAVARLAPYLTKRLLRDSSVTCARTS